MHGPAMRCKRLVDLVACGLASMYPGFDWSVLWSLAIRISERVQQQHGRPSTVIQPELFFV
jgi:hypothetical protein